MYWDHCSLEVQRCVEIGTIRLCFRTSFCSSRALRRNRTGQLDKKLKWECLQVVVLCGRKGKTNHLCWTVEVKLVLRSRVRVWEVIIKSSARAGTCCISLCICCIHLCIWSGFCGRTSKCLSSTDTSKRTSISWIAKEAFTYQAHLFVSWGCRILQSEHYVYCIRICYTSQTLSYEAKCRVCNLYSHFTLTLRLRCASNITTCTPLVSSKPNDDCWRTTLHNSLWWDVGWWCLWDNAWQGLTRNFHTLSRMFSWSHARVCLFKCCVVLEKGLQRYAEIGTIRLCFQTSVCSSRALVRNRTGQLHEE